MIKNLKQFPDSLVLAISFVLLLGGFYGVNLFNKLSICSPFFIFSLLTSLVISEKFDVRIAWVGTLLCLSLNMVFYWPSLQWMHIFSFIGILGAVYLSTQLFSALKSLTSLPTRTFISLSCGIIVDAVAMLPWEIYTFTAPRFSEVLLKSVSYKFSYAALISMGLFLICASKNKTSDKSKIATAIN